MNDEYILTNRFAGYSSYDLTLGNTRKYHGLLVYSSEELDRTMLVQGLRETIHDGVTEIDFSGNLFKDNELPNISGKIRKAFFQPYPTQVYKINGADIVKRIESDEDEQSVLIRYFITAPFSGKLIVEPQITNRNIHELGLREADSLGEVLFGESQNKVIIELGSEVDLLVESNCMVKEINLDSKSHLYPIELERGYPAIENLLKPVQIEMPVDLGVPVSYWVQFSAKANNFGKRIKKVLTNFSSDLDNDSLSSDISRFNKIYKGNEQLNAYLITNARKFAYDNGKNSGIVAGYHWFGPWSRDTLISFKGLLLGLGRYQLARKILLQLSEQFDQGLLLNQIDLGNYNSLDAALWYFQAVHEYYYYTKDKQTVRKLLPVMETTLNSLAKGSKYGIKLNKSGFLIWESPKEALTWMDAKTAQGPVTPRQGAPIEIQALWYNALQVTEKLAAEVSFKLRTGTQIDTFEHMLEMNFSKQFWLEDKNYFTDVIDQFGNKDIKLRPNQLIAFSLAFPIGSKQHWEKLENKIETELYSPVGLKTLSSDHPEYKGEYSGDQTERDMAYHQGTIWPWLLQPYFIGLIRFNKGGRRIVREKLDLFYEKIRLHGLDSVPELFSADRNEPRGAIAQAWSVAALLESVMYLNDTRPEIE